MNKIKSVISILLILLILTMSAYAAPTSAITIEVDKDMETGVVTVTGNTGSSKRVSLLVFNPGKDKGDITYSAVGVSSSAVQKQAQTTANSNGDFTFTFKLNEASMGLTKGECKVYVSSADGTAEDSFPHIPSTLINKIVEDINNPEVLVSAQKLQEIMSANEDILELDFETYTVLGEDTIGLASLAYNAINASEADLTLSEIRKVIQDMSVVECFNKDIKSLVMGEGNTFKYNDLLMLDGGDYAKPYALYTDAITAEGVTAVVDGIFAKNDYTSAEDIRDNFAFLCVLNGINKNKQGGTGHVGAILKDCSGVIGLDITKYLALTDDDDISDADSLIADAKAKDKKTLQGVIDTLVPSEDEDDDEEDYSNRGSSTSISVSGGSNSKEDEIENEEPPIPFDDIETSVWAVNAIIYLNNNGIVNGVADRTFSPNDYVTREQFVKMLVLAKNLKLNLEVETFTDADTDAWYRSYLDIAKSNGIVSGKPDGTFGVGEYITRQDVALMLYRLLGEKYDETAMPTSVTDEGEISAYALEGVKHLLSKGIITGFEDGSFKPAKSCTRAEAAVMVYRMMIGGKSK